VAAKPLFPKKPTGGRAAATPGPSKLPPAKKPAATGRSSAGGQRRTVRI
jgi:hypothetical protein